MAKISLEEIITYSPLNTGGREEVPSYKRRLFSKIHSFLKEKKRFIIGVDGLRRVGKSVLIKQVLNELQQEGKCVFYFSFDKKAHQNIESLEEVIRFFIKKDNQAVIALDEVGKIEDWAGVVKKYYDSSNTTFLVSSSAAIHIRKGTESLAGRMLNYTLPPLGFDEYLELKKVKDRQIKLDFSKPDAPTLFEANLSGFLNKGSYPELSEAEDASVIKNYIKNSTIEKTIFEDVPSIFRISHVSKLLEIFEYFVNYSGNFIHERTISNLIGLSEPTVNDYITYLEKSHLVKRVYTTYNFSKKIRKKKKGYVASSSIYSNITSSFSYGQLIETAVFEKINALSLRTYFDEQKREVDFILQKDSRIRPIEVKSSNSVSRSELSNLIYYMKEAKCNEGYVIYNGPYDMIRTEGMEVYLIPLSTFLAADELIL